LTRDEQAAQAELVAGHIAKQDIVVTTALIPGRPAPKLVSKAMVEAMAPGSVIVDLAAERGGNVELTRPDAVITHNGVTIIGYTNLAGRIPTTASQLYARNLLAFLETLIDKQAKALAIDWEDNLVKATVLTRDGAVVHPNFAAAATPVPAATPAPAKKPAAKKPAAAAAATKKPAATRKAAPKAAAAPATEPAVAKPAVAKPAKPKTARPAAAKPAASAKPAPRKSAASKPAAAKEGK